MVSMLCGGALRAGHILDTANWSRPGWIRNVLQSLRPLQIELVSTEFRWNQRGN